MPEERLQKILATAGVASRRKAEQIIAEGRVTVNGQVVTELGSKADIERDHVKVDGRLLHQPEQFLYIALNKPDCVVSTVSDPQRRTTVMDLLHGVRARVYPVGRLDYHSTGLILLTNDGDFANAIIASRNRVPKTYLVKSKGQLSPEAEEQFRTGIPLSGRRTAPAGLRLMRRSDNPWYEVRLVEGRNQQIRIMFKHLGHLVEKLRRVRIGTIELGSLKPGEFRFLDSEEVRKLMRLAETPSSIRPEPTRSETARPAKKKPASKKQVSQQLVNQQAKGKKAAGKKENGRRESSSKR